MDAFLLDLRYAVRALLNRPGFTALAVLTLAIGIGVNTVAFSALNALLLKPFNVPNASGIGWIMTKSPGNPHGMTSLPDYLDIVRSTRAFEAVIAEGRMPVSVGLRGAGHRDTTSSITEQGHALIVSSNYLRVLGAQPRIGRIFSDDDARSTDLSVVVSERFWTEQLGGGDSVAGRTFAVNGRTASVIGVLRDGFQGPGGLYEPGLWLPLERIEVLNLPPRLQSRQEGWLTLVGRARADVTAPQAEADLQSVFRQLAQDHPDTNKERAGAYHVMADGHPELRGIAKLAWSALGVVGLVLLIACFNVAGLLLARASERRREIGVRAALGAGRGRILRQLITEGTILALMSGAAALVLAAWSADLLSTFSLPSPIPQRLHLGVDARLVGFTALLVAIAGVVPAMVPALQATRADLFRSIRLDGGTGSRPSRARNLFVIAQVAGSTLFLAGALLFVRSFANAAAFDTGFDTDRAVVMELTPSTYGYDAPRSRAFFEQLEARIAAVPGVETVALADRVPFYVGFPSSLEISTDGTDCESVDCRRATTYAVGRNHFAALGIPLRAGREFSDHDLKIGSAAIVSERMAAQFWPDVSAFGAIGQTFRAGKDRRQYEVVGIAADIKHRGMSELPGAFMYRPLGADDFAGRVTVVARTAGDPAALVKAIEDQVQAVDPALPSRSAKTMAQRMEMPLWPARTAAGFFAICGSLALVLATVGLFGVTYYAVNQRTREFGVRVALGATSQRVVTLVLREGLWLAAPGVMIGIGAALMLGRFVSSALFGISSSDPLTLGTTALVECAVALTACALPAWRATHVDPMIALRQE